MPRLWARLRAARANSSGVITTLRCRASHEITLSDDQLTGAYPSNPPPRRLVTGVQKLGAGRLEVPQVLKPSAASSLLRVRCGSASLARDYGRGPTGFAPGPRPPIAQYPPTPVCPHP